MRALPPAVRTELTRAAEANAKAFEAAAEREAPRLTGELRVSVKSYPANGYQGTVWRVRAGVNGGEGFYARFVEFGANGVPANPFFFPVYRAMRPRFRARNARAIKKAQRRVVT